MISIQPLCTLILISQETQMPVYQDAKRTLNQSLRDIKSKFNSLHKMQQGKYTSIAMNSTPKSHMTMFKYKQLIADSSQNFHQTDQGLMSAKHLYCNTGYKSSRRIKQSASTPTTVKLNDCHLTQVDKLLHKKMLSVFPKHTLNTEQWSLDISCPVCYP